MKTKDKNMITEELLAAFEEGKTNAEETALVLEYLATDESCLLYTSPSPRD